MTTPANRNAIREALLPYLSLSHLRKLAAHDAESLDAALNTDEPPTEITALLDVLAAMLRPVPREQITGPSDLAGLLLVEMGALPQEQFRVVCLDTKNHVQVIVIVYQGCVNSSAVRIAEVFREPIRRTSKGIILVHNHPSGDPTPSPEDVAITRQIGEAAKLLGIDMLDHLIIGQGRWVSLRERRLGFDA
jgi:DNA repair protein RadC